MSLLTQFSLLKILSDIYILLLIRMFTIQSPPQFSLFQSFYLREIRPLLNLWCLWKMHRTSSSERWTLVLVLLSSSESACTGGDPSSIPGLRRSAGEGIGYPLQYSWASLVAQMVKKPPAMQEIGVLIPGLWRSPGGGHGNPLQCSRLENPMDRGAWWATVHGVTQSRAWLSDLHFHFNLK